LSSEVSPTNTGRQYSRLRQGPLRAFSHQRFGIFWFFSLLSIVSFFMILIVRGWLILDLTDSAFMVTAVNAAQLLPMLFLPLLGGVLADRGGRKILLVATDVFNLLSLLAMAALLFGGWIEVWHVFALSLANGVAFSFAMPARTSVVPDLVGPGDISSAIALFSTIFSLGQVAGPAPAGFIINAWGMGPAFLVAAVLLAPTIIGLSFFPIPRHAGRYRPDATKPRESVIESILGGFRYVRSQQLLIGLLLLGLVVTMFIMPFQAIMPVIIRDVLNRGPEDLGILMTASGVGAFCGSITVAVANGVRRLNILMFVAGICVGIVLIFFALSSIYILSLFLGFGLGVFVQMFMTSNFTMVQMASPDEVRARIISMRFIAIGLGPIGMISLGIAAEVYGPQPSLVVMAVINIVLVAVVFLAFPSVRRIEAEVAAVHEKAAEV
jgi:MFS family permease